MSSVEFQAGIQSITSVSDSIKVTLVLPNASAQDSALLGWLNQAQHQGSLQTVAITATADSADTERQLRLFENLMLEAMPNPLAHIAAAGLNAGGRRSRLAKVAEGTIENDPAPTGHDEGDAAEDYEPEAEPAEQEAVGV